MSWVQLAMPVTPASLAQIEEALLAAGAVSIALVSDADEPVLEPAPGETPLWEQICLQAVFALSTDMQTVRLALAEVAPDVVADVSFIGEQDWQTAAHQHSVNEIFAGRLWLRPKFSEELPAAHRALDVDKLTHLLLEPGLAFGSGSHPTTRLCLSWLAQNVTRGARILDFGCGSGVLGVAAALLGATVVALDHDPQALLATAENAAYNGLTHKDVTTLTPADWYARRAQDEFDQEFDIVVANILATPLQELAEDFEAVAKSGAHIILSGILPEQAEAVMRSYRRCTFHPARTENGWVLLHGTTVPPP